ncbi:MAG: hypothetical protein WCP29_05415 [Acidobacteriota bacterium]
MPDVARLQAMAARFAPVDIGADISALPPNEQKALGKLVEAGYAMDRLFLRQVWDRNEFTLRDLQADKSAIGQARLNYFQINKGPWSRLDHDAPFVPGVPAKPGGANFYPTGATKAFLDTWLTTLSPTDHAKATAFFTTIRRSEEGQFEITPYSSEYRAELTRAAGLLREAAALTADATLKKFLTTRADAFLSNDYYASDVAWMELDSAIEPTIGPYEVYEDEWFNYKAAFEAFITVRDSAESAKLTKFSGELQEIENHLPIDPKLRNPKLGGMAPIRVVNVVLAAGDGNRGVQTAAFNLPNDERVIREKGAKRVMLKNVQEAKFSKALVPISKVVLSAADQKNVSFEAFFTHILMHELMHGLGPHNITVAGRATTVRQELKETYSAIEEAKADMSGLFALQYLVDKGVIPKSMEQTMYTTFLASAFRSIRFGINEAHGRGIGIQLIALLDAGAFVVAKDGTFAVNPTKIKAAVAKLTGDLMTLEAQGNYAEAKGLIDMVKIEPEFKRLLDKLVDVPVDIQPIFVTAAKLVGK